MDSCGLIKKDIIEQKIINTQIQKDMQADVSVPVMNVPQNIQYRKQSGQLQEAVEDPIQKAKEVEWAKFSDAGDFVEVREVNDLKFLKEMAAGFLPEAEKKNSSFAMKLVGMRLRELISVMDNKESDDEEQQARTARALYDLYDACSRYKKAKFRGGITPKNKRHRILAQISYQACESYNRLKGKQLSLHHEGQWDENHISEQLKGSRLKKVRAALGRLNAKLTDNIPTTADELSEKLEELKEGYFKNLINGFENYLDEHISWSAENENRYSFAYDMYRQYKLVSDFLDSLDVHEIFRHQKAGVKTWQDLIRADVKVLTAPKETVKEKVREETENATEDVKVSVLAGLAGSDVYKKYEKKDDENVFVSEEKRLLTKDELITRAKAEDRIIQYSAEALLQTNEIQILDMLMGVEKREEADFRYDAESVVSKGKEVLMITGVKVVSTKAAFTDVKPGKDLMLPDYKFGINYLVYRGMQDKMKAGRIALKDRIKGMKAGDIINELKKAGVELTKEQTEALSSRLEGLQKLYDSDRYEAHSKYADKDLIADVTQEYRESQILEKAKKNNYKNVKTGEDIEKMSNSGRRMLKNKSALEAALNKNRLTLQKTGEDKLHPVAEELYGYVDEYLKIKDVAEDRDINKLLGEEEKKHGLVKEDKKITGLENVDRESELVPLIRKKLAEYEKLVVQRTAFTDEQLENDIYSFTDEKTCMEKARKQGRKDYATLSGIRRLLWRREADKIKKINDHFRTVDGLGKMAVELYAEESKVIIYRAKKTGEKGVNDADGNESDFVREELKSVKDRPLFAHEPCAEDVIQGGLGDCWLLGTLASICERNPEYIKDMMRDTGDKVIVRLFDKNCDPVFIGVEKTVPSTYSNGALWVQMIEKAITVSGLMEQYKNLSDEKINNIRKKADEDKTGEFKKNHEVKAAIQFQDMKKIAHQAPEEQGKTARSYYTITGGNMDLGFSILTGKQSKQTLYVLGKERGKESEEVKKLLAISDKEIMERYGENIKATIKAIKEMQKDEKNKFVMIAGTYNYAHSEEEGEKGNNFRRGAAGPHMYTLLGVENKDGRDMIKLRNPWGTGKVMYITQKATGIKVPVMGDETDTGTFLMEVKDFAVCFNQVNKIMLTNAVQKK